jgi:hypothetical protein
METINTIELRDENKYPDDTLLESILGKSFDTYKKLLELFDKNSMSYEWRYYRDGKAWLCKVQKAKKTTVWMSAWKGYMQAAIYFPEKHITKVYALDVNEVIIEKFRATKNIGKSKPCIFELKNQKILKDFEKVMMYKIECR